MARKHEPLTFAGSLESQAQKPLDARRKVKLVADLTDAESFPYIYKGLDVFCEENGKWYTFVGEDKTSMSSWREEGSGGGTVDQTYNATSTNAQSGKAVAEAIASSGGGNDILLVDVWRPYDEEASAATDYESEIYRAELSVTPEEIIAASRSKKLVLLQDHYDGATPESPSPKYYPCLYTLVTAFESWHHNDDKSGNFGYRLIFKEWNNNDYQASIIEANYYDGVTYRELSFVNYTALSSNIDTAIAKERESTLRDYFDGAGYVEEGRGKVTFTSPNRKYPNETDPTDSTVFEGTDYGVHMHAWEDLEYENPFTHIDAELTSKPYVAEKIAEAMTDVDNEHFHPVTVLPDPQDEDTTKRPKENHEYILIEYEQDGTTIKSETHYLFYDGAYHQKSTGGISLDGYATEQYVDDGLATKQDVLTTGQGARIRNNVIDTPLLDEIPAIGNRSSFYDQHFYESTKNTTLEYLAQYKSAEDRATVYDADLSNYYWRIKYENNTEEFIDLRNRRITQAGTTDVVRYDAFKIFTDEPYKHMYGDITWIDINPNGDRIFVFGTYTKNVTEEQMGHPRAMSMTPYAKTMIKKLSDIVKADLFAQGIIEERGSDWGVAKSGRLRFVFATQQQEISDLWVDISELGLSSAEDYVVQLTITGGGTMDWGASELFIWEKRTTQFGVTCRNTTSATKDYIIVDYTVIAKGFGGGASGSGSGGGGSITIDTAMSDTSENAVQNKVIKAYVDNVQGLPSGGTNGQILARNSMSPDNAEWIDIPEGSTNFDVTPIPQGPTGANEINAIVSNKATKNVRVSYVRQQDGTLPNTVNFGVKSGIGEDSFVLPTKEYVDAQTGDLTALETTAQDSLVNAVNELKSGLDGLGEPFRVKQWGSNTLNVEIPYCTEDISNANIPKMVFSISDEEGVDYQIVGMLAYEVFDAASGGNRINCFPVCQFTGNGQKELSVRWACMGTTRKTAKRINAWVLLKHR